jgi:predicted transposase/invertase (TIGR01784 family)
VCQLSTGDYAMVEMQVIPQDHWDRRALAYAAAFYGNQLFKGDEWKHIRRVVGVNILGGGKDNLVHWKDTPGQFIRHYKIQEQLHLPARYIDGIELIQYSIMNARGISLEEKEMQDWITFFSKAHYMSEEDVHEQITTPAVLRAFELSKIQKLPREVLVSYEEQDRDYDRYSEHTHGLITQSRDEGHAAGHAAGRVEGIEEGRILEKITLAREMIAHRLEVNLIMEIAKLTREEIEALQRGERLAIERELETARAAATGSAQ